MKVIKVRITLIEEMLGTASANPDVHREFIASKSADAEKMEEEMAALHADEAMDKAMTVFHRDADGTPILWDYQFKGFFKDTTNALREMEGTMASAKTEKRLTKWTYKRTIDNLVFVRPRKMRFAIPAGASMGICTRPLRAETMRGERVALASSETVPAGTEFDAEIVCLDPALERHVMECLRYGEFKGLGQWRNSGKGRFSFELID